jgi:hypothetical protein
VRKGFIPEEMTIKRLIGRKRILYIKLDLLD